PEGPRPPFEWSYFQQRHMAPEHLLQSGTGRLRETLRAPLPPHSPGLARLAAVDAVVAQALARPTPGLLGRAPPGLDRCDQGSGAPSAQGREGGGPASRGGFRHDMRELLLAGLDLRPQPAEGLLAAPGSAPTRSHATNPSAT